MTSDGNSILRFIAGFLVGFVIARVRLVPVVVLGVAWLILLGAKGPHAGLNAAIMGALFFAAVALRVRRFVRQHRAKRDEGYYDDDGE
ncbi:MAG: hypothetical protein M3063_03370 [Actinomycetota bacterium]|nr:hypothetical protein [Actinomycetota bacterium]